MSWHVIFVESCYEETVIHLIDEIVAAKDFTVKYKLLLPKRRLIEKKSGKKREVNKIIFPSYIFVDTQDMLRFYLLIKGIPHIISILRDENFFLEVGEKEIKIILDMVDENGVIGLSRGIIVNQRIKIVAGPLYGREGLIRKIDKRKRRIKTEFKINEISYFIDLGMEDQFMIM